MTRQPRPRRPPRLIQAAALASICLGGPAWAGLGQRRESLEVDRAHLAARMSSAPATGYSVTTLTLPDGATVREFVGQDGAVFAVSWRGHGRPDLRQLLGEHFDALQADTAARAGGHRLRTPLMADRSDFVLRSGGHPGGFFGFAYLPKAAPAGVSMKDLQGP